MNTNTPTPDTKPITAAERMREALSLVLLFHSGVKWDSEAVAKWERGIDTVHDPRGRTPNTHEATTRILCDAARAAILAYDATLDDGIAVALQNVRNFEAVLPLDWENAAALGFAEELQVSSWRSHLQELQTELRRAIDLHAMKHTP